MSNEKELRERELEEVVGGARASTVAQGSLQEAEYEQGEQEIEVRDVADHRL